MARARGLCLVPALDVPQDWRQLCFPARFLFAGRRERLISVMGKAAALGHLWKGTALAVAPIRPAVALKVTGKVRGDRGCSGQGSLSADNSLSKQHIHHCHFPWQGIPNTPTAGLCGSAVNFIITSFHLMSTSMGGRAGQSLSSPNTAFTTSCKPWKGGVLSYFVVFCSL